MSHVYKATLNNAGITGCSKESCESGPPLSPWIGVTYAGSFLVTLEFLPLSRVPSSSLPYWGKLDEIARFGHGMWAVVTESQFGIDIQRCYSTLSTCLCYTQCSALSMFCPWEVALLGVVTLSEGCGLIGGPVLLCGQDLRSPSVQALTNSEESLLPAACRRKCPSACLWIKM